MLGALITYHLIPKSIGMTMRDSISSITQDQELTSMFKKAALSKTISSPRQTLVKEKYSAKSRD
jgi:hypothetical protein